MLAKKIGDPCPKCAAPLLRRRSTSYRAVQGDVAYCGRCNAAYELAAEPEAAVWAAA